MGNAKLLPAIGVFVLAAATGCGDGPICQSEILLLIQTPQGAVLADSNEDMEGVQTEVRVRSTLPEDVEVELIVLDEDENEVFTDTARTDEDGDVAFEDVDLPDGAATIRVTADAGECGSDEDEVVLDVAAGRDCELTIRQEPLDNDFYDPMGVLNLSNDDNPGMPNFQADIDVSTAPGYDVELFVTGGEETSAGTETADADGDATFAISLAQGRQVLRAVCSSPNGALTAPSINTAVFVDTVAPDCEMTGPAPGDPITSALDDDNNITNGIQMTFTAHADGGDLEGEASTFVLMVGASTTTAPGVDFDANGDTSVDATIDLTATPLTASIAMTAADHAGNGCDLDEDYDIEYVCAPQAFGEIGGACGVAADCGTADSFCYVGAAGPVTFAPEGYCMVDDFSSATGTCDDDTDCPTGTECTGWDDFPGYSSCMPTCGCTGPSSCPTNQDCLSSFNGLALDGTVCVPGDGDAVDGEACDGFYECDEYSECLDDVEYPNGQCARYSCTLGNDATCNGGHCVTVEAPFSGTTCVDTCTSTADCRGADGYVCFDPDGAGTAPNYCRHPHIGDACTSATSCGGAAAGWSCRTGGTFVGGYCTLSAPCPTPGSLAGCTDGSVCFDAAAASNFCVDRCTGTPGTQGSCRTGYLCTDTDPGGATTLGCTPL